MDVRDLENTRFDRLNVIAQPGRGNHHGGVRSARDLDFILPDADGLDDDDVESARILAQARTEAEAILTATRSDAMQFREELKQQSRAEAAAIVKNAEKQVELEKTRALQEIRQEAVNLSVTIASKLLQRNVSKDDNLRLIEDTFKQIEATERPS